MAVARRFQIFLSRVMKVYPLIVRVQISLVHYLLALLLTTHAIPPQRAVGSRTSAHLCIISAAAIQALEPDCFSSGNSFFHLCSFLHVSTVHQHFKAVSCCKSVAMLLQSPLFVRCSLRYLARILSASARACFVRSSSAFILCHSLSRRCSSMRT